VCDNAIEVQNLTKRYGQRPLLGAPRFRSDAERFLGCLVPTAPAKPLLGLTEISDGQVRLLGYDPVREPLAVKRRAGYLPDAVGFYDNLSAADNLRYTARLNGFTPAEREDRIKSSLAHAGLTDVTDKRNKRSKVRVGTTHRSMAAIACAWFRKNVFQLCDGDPPCTMYFETVDWATSKPSINSSPWIRDAPQFEILFDRRSSSSGMT
jgi:ABC-type multidrug transport system ATPase subunit